MKSPTITVLLLISPFILVSNGLTYCGAPMFSSVQSLSHVRLSATPCTAARQASLSIINSQRFFKLMFIESVMPSNHPILCHPLLLCLQSGSFPVSQFFPSSGQSIGVSPSTSVPSLTPWELPSDFFEIRAQRASQMPLVVKKLPANAGDVRDVGSIPGSGRSPGGGLYNPLPVFLLGESQGQRNLGGYSP